jgi:integrase
MLGNLWGTMALPRPVAHEASAHRVLVVSAQIRLHLDWSPRRSIWSIGVRRAPFSPLLDVESIWKGGVGWVVLLGWVGRSVTCKTAAGVRDVSIPPRLLPIVEDHLAHHTGPGPDALLLPAAQGSHMWAPTSHKSYRKVREAAGQPDLRFHDLRHTGAVLAAATGEMLAELMQRLGHTTAGAAMRYQYARHVIATPRSPKRSARIAAGA